MSKGISVTPKEAETLAAEAEDYIDSVIARKTYDVFYPVFDKFLARGLTSAEAFDYVLAKGKVEKKQRKSFQNAFSKRKQEVEGKK